MSATHKKLLKLSEKRSYQKEPEEAWLYRNLNIDPKKTVTLITKDTAHNMIEVVNQDKTNRFIEVTTELWIAVSSWIKYSDNPEDHKQGTAVIVMAPNGCAFLMQRKDNLHPNPIFRGRLSFPGGSAHEGERPGETAYREIFEEFEDPAIANLITGSMQKIGYFDIPKKDHCRAYRANTFAIELTWDEWDQVCRSVLNGGFSEATPAIVTREEFEKVLHIGEVREECRYFVASHNELVPEALSWMEVALLRRT